MASKAISIQAISIQAGSIQAGSIQARSILMVMLALILGAGTALAARETPVPRRLAISPDMVRVAGDGPGQAAPAPQSEADRGLAESAGRGFRGRLPGGHLDHLLVRKRALLGNLGMLVRQHGHPQRRLRGRRPRSHRLRRVVSCLHEHLDGGRPLRPLGPGHHRRRAFLRAESGFRDERGLPPDERVHRRPELLGPAVFLPGHGRGHPAGSDRRAEPGVGGGGQPGLGGLLFHLGLVPELRGGGRGGRCAVARGPPHPQRAAHHHPELARRGRKLACRIPARHHLDRRRCRWRTQRPDGGPGLLAERRGQLGAHRGRTPQYGQLQLDPADPGGGQCPGAGHGFRRGGHGHRHQ